MRCNDPQPMTANGSTEPCPIPWLDKNGNHNQPAGPSLEPSHIYHFKGRVARCSTFTGMGTDNQGNRTASGSPTTDYGVMLGDYWAPGQSSNVPLLTYDSRCSGDRLSPLTRYTTFARHRAVRTLVGRSGSRGWSGFQSRRQHLHA